MSKNIYVYNGNFIRSNLWGFYIYYNVATWPSFVTIDNYDNLGRREYRELRNPIIDPSGNKGYMWVVKTSYILDLDHTENDTGNHRMIKKCDFNNWLERIFTTDLPIDVKDEILDLLKINLGWVFNSNFKDV